MSYEEEDACPDDRNFLAHLSAIAEDRHVI
jgi:hypothetical protein